MISLLSPLLVSLLLSGPNSSGVVLAPAPVVFLAADPAVAADSSIDDLLHVLHQRGIGLNDFDSAVTLKEKKKDVGDVTTKVGRVTYHNDADPAKTKLLVKLDKRQNEGEEFKPYRLDYMLDGPNLIDRNYAKKIETRQQVMQPGEKVNLLKLGEGPFPLPIGQEPEEVKKQFEVTKLEAEGGMPRLRLVPRKGTSLANKFARIDVWISPTSHFPEKIETEDTGTVSTVEFGSLRLNPNPPLGAADFELEPTKGWAVTIK